VPSVTPDLPAGWSKFLSEIDRTLTEPVELHCLGGFVMTLLYGLSRSTSDIDYIEIVPPAARRQIQAIAGIGSDLHKKFGLYLEHVGVADLPESYSERLVELFPGRFRHLRIFALEPHDLALSKLTRNSPIDQEDVQYLAQTGRLDSVTLRTRYQDEMKSRVIGPEERHDLTMELWLEYFPKSSSL
jgi:hypothetical protein